MNRIETPQLQGRITAGRGLAVSAGLTSTLISRRGAVAKGVRVPIPEGAGTLVMGRGVRMSGRDLVVTPPPVNVTPAQRTDARRVTIWGKIEQRHVFSGVVSETAGGNWFPATKVAGEGGADGNFLRNDSLFWQTTQLVDVTYPEGGSTHFEFVLELTARLHLPASGPYFPDLFVHESDLYEFGSPRGPYLLELEEYVSQVGRPYERVTTHRLQLPATGSVRRRFQASRPGVFCELLPISITRI